MANTIRFILAGFSIYLLGAYLYESPELVEIRFLSFHPMRSIRHGSSLLLTTICAFVILEMFLIGWLFRQRVAASPGHCRQFGIGSLLCLVPILALPLGIAPIYESVVATVPDHPQGDRGLPIWLFIGITYFMLVPIAYLCHSVQQIVRSLRSSSD